MEKQILEREGEIELQYVPRLLPWKYVFRKWRTFRICLLNMSRNHDYYPYRVTNGRYYYRAHKLESAQSVFHGWLNITNPYQIPGCVRKIEEDSDLPNQR